MVSGCLSVYRHIMEHLSILEGKFLPFGQILNTIDDIVISFPN